MSTNLSFIEQAFSRDLEQLVSRRIEPLLTSAKDETSSFKAIFDVLGERGYLGIEVPEDRGGAGGSCYLSTLIIKSLARIDNCLATTFDLHTMLVTEIFRRWGSSDQQIKYLQRMASQDIGSLCLLEPDSRFAAFNLKSQAQDCGTHWMLTGKKICARYSSESGVFVIFASSPSIDPRNSMSAFICEADMPGFSLNTMESTVADDTSSYLEVVLDKVRVPKENIIGQPGDGYGILVGMLGRSRINVTAQILGLVQAALRKAGIYARQREESSVGSGQRDDADAYLQLSVMGQKAEEAQKILDAAARSYDAGLNYAQEAAHAQMLATLIAEDLVSSRRQMPLKLTAGHLSQFSMRLSLTDELASLRLLALAV
jgi:butyryl-CoA dehydrogenase/short/branched chain acyl-CoA dehydrogenase